jgi:hypothetical protein
LKAAILLADLGYGEGIAPKGHFDEEHERICV